MAAEDPNGRNLLPRTRKTRAILAVLALAAPRPVLRQHLTGLLWSQREKEQARASLRQSVHELQATLGSACGHMLVAERHHLALRDAGLWHDVQVVTEGKISQPETLDLFRTPLLEDLAGLDPAFDRWLEQERLRLSRIARTVGESMLDIQRGTPGELAIAERLLAIDPAHEAAWRAKIQVHIERNDRAAALGAYERYRAVVAGIAQGDLSPEIEGLVAWLRSTRHAQQPPAVPDTPPEPLPRSSPPGFARGVPRCTIRLGVMPLRSIDPGAGGTPLTAGLAEEITTALARYRWIACVAGTSIAALTGPLRQGVQLWEQLQLDLLLDGTIQRSGHRVRVTMRLLDMRAGGQVAWARRFDRELGDVLTVQEDIAAEIAAQLEPELLVREGERIASLQLAQPSAEELIRQAVPIIYRLESGRFRAAGHLLETALTIDPASGPAHTWYAYWHMLLVGQGWAEDPETSTRRAVELAEQAVMLDPGDARALTIAGHARGFLGKRAAEAATLHERAIALNPNLALAWCFSGLACCYLGQHDEAARRMQQACRLSPWDPHSFFFEMALIMPHLLRGEYETASEAGRRAIDLNPGFSSSYKGYLATLGHLGRSREASAVLVRLLALEPGFTVTSAIERSPMTCPGDVMRYAEGLRLAGLTEEARPPRRGLALMAPAARLPVTIEPIDLGSWDPHSHTSGGMAPAVSGRLVE